MSQKKIAKRDAHRGKSWTLALYPSDRYTPRYYKLSHRFLGFLLLFVFLAPLYSYFIYKNAVLWQQMSSDYVELRIANNLQQTKVDLAVQKHKQLKDHIHKLKKQEEEIKELLSINFDEEKNHNVDLYSYPMITTHRILSKYGEFARVMIDNNIVVEYFDKNKEKPEAYQRALVTAERIKAVLASRNNSRRYSLSTAGDKVSAYINNQLVFVVVPEDVANIREKLSTHALAKMWLNNIKQGLSNQEDTRSLVDRLPWLDRDYRKSSKLYRTLYPSIEYPSHTVLIADEQSAESISRVSHLLKLAQQEVAIYNKSFVELKDTVQMYKQRFEYTPSIYPLRSSFVLSDFGWRVHPILQRMRLHTGVDLPTWANAPIYATASGVVSKAGWMGGYGNRIEIDHGYGFSTVYAHGASIIVGVGEFVRKGQVIGYAGMTGLAQGVHCHYEVRYFDRPVNPNRFLNLNIFTASKNW